MTPHLLSMTPHLRGLFLRRADRALSNERTRIIGAVVERIAYVGQPGGGDVSACLVRRPRSVAICKSGGLEVPVWTGLTTAVRPSAK